MIRGPQGPRMLCSPQPNREFARAPTRIFVWRQSLRVGVRADGTDLYGKSESLRGARGGPDRRRVPAARRSRQYLKRAHGVLVRDGGLESETHGADVNDPVYLERMEMVNDLCPWLKRYLWRFTGMSPWNPQAYLDWYVYLFRVN